METTANGPCTTAITSNKNSYEVQTGINKGSYVLHAAFTCETEALKSYEDIKCKPGQKKRLMLNGVCLKRLIA